MKSIKLTFILLFSLLLFASSSFSLAIEWGVINPTDLVASDEDMLAVISDYYSSGETAPAYFIWATDESLTSWNIVWTGGDSEGANFFSGTIALENAVTDEFVEVSFDSNDRSYGTTTGVSYMAYAIDYYDGISFTITTTDSPSYVGFDLFIDNSDADSNYIFLGLDFETVASLGEDQDFAIAAPVPEPATMLLLGSGLLGFAARRKKK